MTHWGKIAVLVLALLVPGASLAQIAPTETTLTWTDNSAGLTNGTSIERAPYDVAGNRCGGYAVVGSAVMGLTTYKDTVTLADGERICYRVRVFTGTPGAFTMTSDYSNEAVYTKAPTVVAPVVTKLVLVNTDTDQPIPGYDPLPANSSINLADPAIGRNISIRAFTEPATAGSVRFTVDGITMPVENTAPYVIGGDLSGDIQPWRPSLGAHTIVVVAYSAANASGVASAPVQISMMISDVPANKAPVVNAGADKTATIFPSSTVSVTLTGTASDDGQPTPPALTYAWTMLSGPTAATMATPKSATTVVTFTAAGVYTFRLTASDGALWAWDDVVVTIQQGLPAPTNLKVAVGVTTNSVQGWVASSPPGIDCNKYGGSGCSYDFPQNSSVTLTSRAHSNSRFLRWEGGCAGTTVTCVVSMTNAKTVQAVFGRR